MLKGFPLHYAAFVAALGVMGLEVMGLGMVAPYFGTSLVVQTNVIGVVLASLAWGYRRGGLSADRGTSTRALGHLLLIAALWIGSVFALRDIIASFLGSHLSSVALGSLFTSILLFSVPSIMLGMVLPHAIKLTATDVASSGKKSGVLYGISSAGSIAGTIAVAFFVLPMLRYDNVLLSIVVVLLIGALLLGARMIQALAVLGLSISLLLVVPVPEFPFHKRTLFSDGKVQSDVTTWTKLADETGIFSRLQVYEGVERTSGRPIRFLLVNGEVHSATYLDSNELVFNYALYNRLGGHFNPAAKRALLIGGGGYSYANYFLTDTPLYDREKVWELRGNLYHNNRTVSLPILFSRDPMTRLLPRSLVFESSTLHTGGESEGEHNRLEVENQAPSSTVTILRADILDTGFDDPRGYVHIHETKNDGTPGRVVSDDVLLQDYIQRPRTIIGKGSLISGENAHISVPLDRPVKEGEVLYAMLHRDNGNGHFDDFLVDGYEQIESLDVVEIDPRTTRLAETYFHLNREDPRLRIFHEDGRTFINRSEDTYDIIYIDAFRSFYAVPWQLTTREATERIYEMLRDDGVVVANIPAALSGEHSKFFQAELRTYESVFPEVRVYASLSPTDVTTPQNIILVAFKSNDNIRETRNDDADINEQLLHRWYQSGFHEAPILTDDYAPTDYFTGTFADIHQF